MSTRRPSSRKLHEEDREVVEIEYRQDGLETAALATEEALHAGAEIVYQGVLASENWRGIADFLIRVDEPSSLGSFRYEAWDTKLARWRARPAHVLQLTFYSHELERIQGQLPQRMHVVLGTGQVETYRPADCSAFFRRDPADEARRARARYGGCPAPCTPRSGKDAQRAARARGA
jgi:predicted RecB family nuclease